MGVLTAYLGLSCRNALCGADGNAAMFSVRDDISALLLAEKK
jgi:hypothetical protein